METIEVVFFDLFFTLIKPKYEDEMNEYDVLGMTPEEWKVYSEDDELYAKRATGKVNSAVEIINDIVNIIPMQVTKYQKEEILNLRQLRMKKALTNVDSKVLEVLATLKDRGKRICLISNADIIDVMHWKESKLADYFEQNILSYEVGYVKPSPKIYQIAMERMNVEPAQCIFIGDGGSDELRGAKELGMKTVFTEYFEVKNKCRREKILEFADYHISDFMEILDL